MTMVAVRHLRWRESWAMWLEFHLRPKYTHELHARLHELEKMFVTVLLRPSNDCGCC